MVSEVVNMTPQVQNLLKFEVSCAARVTLAISDRYKIWHAVGEVETVWKSTSEFAFTSMPVPLLRPKHQGKRYSIEARRHAESQRCHRQCAKEWLQGHSCPEISKLSWNHNSQSQNLYEVWWQLSWKLSGTVVRGLMPFLYLNKAPLSPLVVVTAIFWCYIELLQAGEIPHVLFDC